MLKSFRIVTLIAVFVTLAGFILQPNQQFVGTSYVHTLLPANAPLDPNSAAIVADMLANTPGGWSVSVSNYASPLYFVTNEPTVTIKGARNFDPTFDSWGKVPLETILNPVPLPGNFLPASGSDASAIICRMATNECWELWYAQLTGGTTVNSAGQTVPEWSAGWGGHMTNVSSNPGYFLEDPRYPGWHWGSSASSIPQMLFMTIEEQRLGVIRHPLAFGTTCTARGHVFPAQRDDGWSDTCLPKEGMIFRLPASLNIDALPLTPYAKMIAKAIQNYGMVLVDTTGGGFSSIAAEAQGNNYHPGWSDVYWDPGGILGCPPPPTPHYSCWPDNGPGHLLDGFPFNQLQVIQPRSQ